MPWKPTGETVAVVVAERQVSVLYAGAEVASHAQSRLRRASVLERSHLVGIVGAQLAGETLLTHTPQQAPPPVPAELLRLLLSFP